MAGTAYYCSVNHRVLSCFLFMSQWLGCYSRRIGRRAHPILIAKARPAASAA